MVVYRWVDFTITDLSFDECETYTKDKFEELVQDKFAAVQVEEDGCPKYIWTDNMVFTILNRHRLMGQLALVGCPRYPDHKFN